MAFLVNHPKSGYLVRFRYGGTNYFRSLDTHEEIQAKVRLGQITETLSLIKRGVILLPANLNVDEAGTFILTGGKIARQVTPALKCTLADVAKAYIAQIPSGAKADSSLLTERIHIDHFTRLLGKSVALDRIGTDQLQAYVNRRASEPGLKGKKLSPDTIRKELGTFGQLWGFAKARGWVSGDSPKSGVKLPKSAEKPPFQTWQEIERAIKNGGAHDLWDNLFLDESQILELLDFVREKATYPFIHPMFAFAALTGARRSEIIRSERQDWLFDWGAVQIREKKRKHNKSGSYRQVQLHSYLAEVMKEWFNGKHPGGCYAICSTAGMPLTEDAAHHHFTRTLASGKWSVVRGFHALRHSFVSIAAMKGVPSAVLQGWVGHETEEMQARYRHLFPKQQADAMSRLFSGAS